MTLIHSQRQPIPGKKKLKKNLFLQISSKSNLPPSSLRLQSAREQKPKLSSTLKAEDVPLRLVLRDPRLSGSLAEGGEDSLPWPRQCRQDYPSPHVEGWGVFVDPIACFDCDWDSCIFIFIFHLNRANLICRYFDSGHPTFRFAAREEIDSFLVRTRNGLFDWEWGSV